MKRIGWIGLGNMGVPMAKNLEKAGFPLSVYNRSKDKMVPFNDSATKTCNSIEELINGSDIIFTMISNDAAVKAVYDEILLLGSVKGKLFIDMSTISQKFSETMAQSLMKAGASFIDAPVAGSTVPAREGTLIIMAGGREEDVQIAEPYFSKLGKKTVYMGGNGKGIAAKLCINYFVSIIYHGLAESVLFAEKKGIARSEILEIINESATGSGATKVKTPLLINNDYSPAFALDFMLKDILLAKENGVDYPMTQVLIDTFKGAQQAGYGEQDVMSVINFLKKE